MLVIIMSFLLLNINFFKKLIKYKYLYIYIIFVYFLNLNFLNAQERVDIKGFDTDLFSRLVFNWQSPVEYQAEIQGKELTIRFDRPGLFEIEKIKNLLPKVVNSSSYNSKNTEIKIILNNNYEIKTTANESSVIFEIQQLENSENIKEISVPKIDKELPQFKETSGIRVRLGKHEKYSRIVFDWNDKVKYKLEKNLDTVIVRFSQKVKFTFPRNYKNIVSYIYNISQEIDGNESLIKIKTSDEIKIRDFVNNKSVVIDLIHDNKLSKVNIASKNINKNINEKNITKSVITDNDLKIELEEKKINDGNNKSKEKKSTKDDEKNNNKFTIEKPGKLNIDFLKNDDGLLVSFKWQNPTTAAVFERAGYNWILFGGSGPFNISPIGKEFAKDLISIESIKIMRGLAFRLKVREGLFANVTRRGSNWNVEFKSNKRQLNRPLLARGQPNWPTGPRVFIPVEGASSRIAIADPEVGDDLAVIPILQDGRGRAQERIFAQFKLLQSAQGIVVERRSDDIRVATANYGVEISSPNIGLALSNNKKELLEDKEVSGEEDLFEDVSSILDFVAWRGETNIENLDQFSRQLQLSASKAAEDEKIESYIDIARLYISYGLSAEALGYLRLAYDIDPSIEQNLEYKAIRGASSYLLGRIDEASKDLLEPDFGVDPSVSLWKGAILAARKEWQESRQEFQLGVIALSDLTPELRVKFQLLAAETAFKAGEVASAELEVESIDPEEASLESISRGKLIIGLARMATGDKVGGLDILNEVVNEKYRPTWAEAQIVYSIEKYKLGQMNIENAIDNLESLLFVWRGGQFELSLLKNLRDLYLENENFRGAMNSLRTIKTAFKGTIDSEKAEKDLNNLFLRLYLDGESEKMPPIKALALYNEFSELTPEGEVGDKIINKLSERLVSVDLLEQAAQLLNYQVSFRLKGIEKGRIASKLAAVYLFDRETKKCIEVLDNSEFELLPQELKLERLFLRARAYLLDENYDKVLDLLKNNSSRESNIIRAEVFWKSKDWVNTVSELEKALDLRWQSNEPLNFEERNQVMQMTVSLALLDDWENLNLVRDKWLNLMTNSQDAEPFDILTLSPDTDSVDFRKVAGRIAQIDTLDAFMKRYKRN
ncbi:MAG: hypothetical protein CMM49_06960 [Rhodospirillaceae bacterium]|nr:hypothetical protein [Rhodospirillaceae bacterium]